eukprot:15462142-Alexandrium_andersonii.AAC.1
MLRGGEGPESLGKQGMATLGQQHAIKDLFLASPLAAAESFHATGEHVHNAPHEMIGTGTQRLRASRAF